ncbi:TPM domain-containing protein [Candidatus Pacearchaeota archaeon]|nr:TPM domain-containing protein [Candidatus Pacearchaeota archaeon]
MQRFVTFVFLFFLSCIFVSALSPSYSGWVNDYGDVLTQGDRASLEALFTLVEQNTTAEVVFVSVNTTAPDVPSAYRTKLFREWGIGKKDKNNGLLILYSVTEKRIEVEVGYGLEGILPDGKVGRYLDNYYVPARDGGNISEGIVAFAEAIADELVLNTEEIRSGQRNEETIDTFGEVLVLLVILGLFIWFWWYVVHGPGKKRFGLFPVFFGGRGGHSSFGGGGFSGFGGGMSGGGGAGR